MKFNHGDFVMNLIFSTHVTSCPAGSISASAGSSICESCDAGFYASDDPTDISGIGVSTKATSCKLLATEWDPSPLQSANTNRVTLRRALKRSIPNQRFML